MTLFKINHQVGNCKMLPISEIYCDLRDLTIGKRNVFMRWFSGLSLDGAVVSKMVDWNIWIMKPWITGFTESWLCTIGNKSHDTKFNSIQQKLWLRCNDQSTYLFLPNIWTLNDKLGEMILVHHVPIMGRVRHCLRIYGIDLVLDKISLLETTDLPEHPWS